MQKFALSSPAIMGSFPACALVYRRGDVKEAEAVVHQSLSENDLYALDGSGAFAAQALDALRQKDVPPGASASGAVNSIDPFAFYVGKVQREYGGLPDRSRQMNLSGLIDRQRKTIRSATGEMTWDYGNGVVRMDTARSQGAAGFLGRAGRIELSCADLECANEYASVIVTSLDDKPLIESRRMLIQAMTVERPFGFRASGGKAGRIEDLGTGPFGVEKIAASVVLRWPEGTVGRVTALDPHGYARAGQLTLRPDAGRVTIKLREDSVYHLVTR